VTDPIQIWQNQPINQLYLACFTLHQKGRSIQALTRRKLLVSLAAPVIVGAFGAYTMRSFPTLSQPPLIAAFLWSLAGTYFLHRGMWAEENPANTGLTSGLDFCRHELARQSATANRILLCMLGPILLVLGLFLYAIATLAGGLSPKALPFIAMLAIWTIAVGIQRFNEQRSFRRELEELNRIERQFQSHAANSHATPPDGNSLDQ
jgi:hypothetical protein